MKKFLKRFGACFLALICVFSFAGCTTELSATTVDTSKVVSVNDVSTNGGYTVIYDGYIYFINGTKDNDGTNSSGNKRGGIVRAEYDSETGVVAEDATYEVIVDDLVGYDDGSIYFFGDFLYYTTPSEDVNYQGTVLYYKVRFKRYDLVNKETQEIYTTQLNTEDDSLDYAYYISGEKLILLVYESENESLTSITIGDTMTTNYVIEDVQSCLFSENYGTCVTDEKTIDANTYVYYTLSHGTYDSIQSGNIVYRTLPDKNTSVCISNEGKSVTLLCIRNGKLIYSYDTCIYCQSITGESGETLKFVTDQIISYVSYENVIFIENDDGSVSLLYMNDDTYQIVYMTWKNGVVIDSTTIGSLDEPSDFSMVGLVTIEEEVKSEDDSTSSDDGNTESGDGGETNEVAGSETESNESEGNESEGNEGEGNETEEVETEDNESESNETEEVETEEVVYLIYIESNVIYKLEISRKASQDEEATLTKWSQPIQLSDTAVVAASGKLAPEIVGTNVYVFGNEVDEDDAETGNVYMFVIDLTPTDDVEEAGTMIALTED